MASASSMQGGSSGTWQKLWVEVPRNKADEALVAHLRAQVAELSQVNEAQDRELKVVQYQLEEAKWQLAEARDAAAEAERRKAADRRAAPPEQRRRKRRHPRSRPSGAQLVPRPGSPSTSSSSRSVSP